MVSKSIFFCSSCSVFDLTVKRTIFWRRFHAPIDSIVFSRLLYSTGGCLKALLIITRNLEIFVTFSRHYRLWSFSDLESSTHDQSWSTDHRGWIIILSASFRHHQQWSSINFNSHQIKITHSDGSRVQFHWIHRHCFFSKETWCFIISFNKLVGLIVSLAQLILLLTERHLWVNDKEAFLSSYFNFKKLALFSLASFSK
jgi:hypothetical protein